MKSTADIADLLRSQLKAMGMTQAALREAAGLSSRTLTLLLSGSHDFKLSTLLAVADRLGLELVLLPKAAVAGLVTQGTAPAAVPSLIDLAQQAIGGRGAGAGGDQA